jgi:hypothetical protein
MYFRVVLAVCSLKMELRCRPPSGESRNYAWPMLTSLASVCQKARVIFPLQSANHTYIYENSSHFFATFGDNNYSVD